MGTSTETIERLELDEIETAFKAQVDALMNGMLNAAIKLVNIEWALKAETQNWLLSA